MGGRIFAYWPKLRTHPVHILGIVILTTRQECNITLVICILKPTSDNMFGVDPTSNESLF